MKKKTIKIDGEIALNFIVSVGAAVVLFGAWAKLLHKSFADTMLTVGLLTECAIFLLYAFMPPKKSGADAPKVIHHNHPVASVGDTKDIQELNATLKKIFNQR
jgi:hypothetical protein